MLSCTPSYVVSPKQKKSKVNINNDLAILPSHDSSSVLSPKVYAILVCGSLETT